MFVGASVDVYKRGDWTPLMLACTKTDENVVNLLLDNNADVSLQNKDGWTALHIACRDSSPQIVELILNKDPKLVNTPGKTGRSPLHTAGNI